MSVSSAPMLRPVVVSALSHLHPGAGRSPGVVDLPVVRDPLGFFYVPGSGLKGALKSSLALRYGCVDGKGDKVDCGLDADTNKCRDGKEKCCPLLCCLLGGEVGEGPEAPSRLSLGDLYPLLVPVPSLSHGLVYATSPYLVSAASQVVEAAGDAGKPLAPLLETLREAAGRLQERGKPVLVAEEEAAGELYLGLTRLQAGDLEVLGKGLDTETLKLLQEVNPAYSMLSPAGRLLVVSDTWLLTLAERALVRLTRVRLDRSKKTVATRALWTEEYIPRLTLFTGYVADTRHTGKYCEKAGGVEDAVQELVDMMGGPRAVLVLGGKETVGKGLAALRVL